MKISQNIIINRNDYYLESVNKVVEWTNLAILLKKNEIRAESIVILLFKNGFTIDEYIIKY